MDPKSWFSCSTLVGQRRCQKGLRQSVRVAEMFACFALESNCEWQHEVRDQ